MPENHLMRWPILTTFKDTVYFAANVYPIAGTSVGDRPIYLTRFPGGVVAAPAGNFQFVYPKTIAAPNGDIHLVWAEFASMRQDALTWGDGFQTTLWHSALRHGAWITPEQILQSRALQWTQDDGHLAIDGRGALHVVVWAVRDPYVGVVHLHREGFEWRVEPVPGAMREATAIQAIGDSLLIAFVGDSFGPSDTTGVTVLRSTDRGTTWGKPVVIQRLGERFAWHPQFVRSEKATLLIWAESPSGRFSRDTLRIVRLGEFLQPIPVASLSLPVGAQAFSFAAMPCGDVSILIGTLTGKPRVFEVTVGPRGAVVPPVPLLGDQGTLFPSIGATSREFIAVLAALSNPGIPAKAVVMTRPGCRTAH